MLLLPRLRPVLGAALAAGLLLGLSPSTASAGLVFEMDYGTVEIYLEKVGTGVDYAHLGPFDLNGPDDFAEFSPSPVALEDFQFSALSVEDQILEDLTGSSTLPGLWGWFDVDIDVVATPGIDYTATGTDLGGGNYLLEGTDVDLTGTVTVNHWLGESKSVVLSFPEYTANANLSSTMLVLDRMMLGGIILHDEFGVDHAFEMRADIVFSGTLVPEPGTALLLGGGLLALGLRRRVRHG